jgi:hypothetical protein
MAYIGNSPANVGNYQILDDISSSFNGSLTTFALTTSSVGITPIAAGQVLISINGVIQEPDNAGTDGFKVSGGNVVFSSAPASGDTFWGVFQGAAVDIGIPSDDVVDTIHIKDNAITADKIAAGAVVADIATGGVSTAKIADDAVTADKLANAINSAIAANTAKTGITSGQASAITANTAKTGITSGQAGEITANTAKTGITSGQASAITANTAKTGITSGQASAITANTAKTGITSGQASAITANTAKTGITSGQASAITANTAKTGITSGQASAITANTAKVTNATHTGDVTGSGALTIATDAVTTTKILDGAITAAKINSAVALGGPSLGTDSVIRTNAQTISENITIGATTNGMSAGPITIADTYTVTVNGNWSIV